MSETINCPKCEHSQEVDYDQMLETREGEYNKIECEKCGEWYVWTVYVTYSAHEAEAPCLNGGSDHNFASHITYKDGKKMRVKKCEFCDYREEVPT